MRVSSMFVLGSVFVLGCRGGGGGGGGGSADAPNTGGQKIQDVQNDMMAPGTPVSLHGVVVTAIDTYGMKTGDIWVEEPEGGAFSGIHVFGVPTSTVAGLALGDIVDVSGAVKDEFALATDTSGRTVTELKAATGGMITVNKTGTGTVPAPQVVDALAIGMMADEATRSAEWEKWEGVLITVNNVTELGAARPVSSTDMTLQNFGVTGDVKVESALAAFPTSGLTRSTCLASITGVEDYFFDYLILPRQTTEVATGGTACPAPENTATLCADGIDNDGNTFADCMDDGCIPAVNTCRMTATINALDTATTPPTGGIEIDGVYITAISHNGKDFWVSSVKTAAPNEGLYVYANGQALPTGAVVGAKVNVIGKASAFNNDMMGNALLEFNMLQVSVVAAPTGQNPAPSATAMTAATLTTDAGGKPMISSLVQMNNVAVVTLGNAGNHGAGTMKQGGVTFEYQSDALPMYLPTTEMGKCYGTIIGLWSYDVYTNMYSLEPLAAGTGTGTCI